MRIQAYTVERREELLALSLRAWEPVFADMRPAVPGFVYESFYPAGWRARQSADLSALLDDQPGDVAVALDGETAVGWICVTLHPEDSMGEIHVLAVDPRHQRRGIATLLMEYAYEIVRAAGMRMVMVETGGDPGHAAARATYEDAGFQRWPVARYFKDLAPETDS